MALSAGDRLGSYEILEPLGAGGMGEVYRAVDPKLGRDVALKVLPSEVAREPERLGRFRREAHLLASLNHPNIATIHGLEEAGGQPFLVLELVGGEDLRQRLDRGAIPLEESLEIARQGGQLSPLGIHVGSLDRPDERRPFLPGPIFLGLGEGHVIFNREDTLFAQAFDADRLELHGEPVAIASSLPVNGNGWGQFGVSPGGTLTYMTGVGDNRFQIAWLDRKGKQVGTVGAPGVYSGIALSPDEKRVAVVVRGPETQWDLWVIDTARGAPSRLTSGPRNEFNPVWSPDGRELAFNKPATDGISIFRMGLLGGASAEPQLESPGYDFLNDWSRDGGTLLYERAEIIPSTEASLWALPLTGDGPPELVARQAGFRLVGAQLSPDGRWLAYVSNESGEWDVYVQPFRRTGERMRVSLDGGRRPIWREDGRELYYRKLDGPLVAVEVTEVAGTLELGLPIELFDVSEMWSPAAMLYAVSADGQRFLAKVPVEGGRKPQMHVVVNWESLLE